jgi:protein-tyrosine-phosphatase
MSVLFVCVENSNRSQMSEAFARMHGGDKVVAASVGSRPSGRVNPRVVEFMREVGCDLPRTNPNHLTSSTASQSQSPSQWRAAMPARW